MAAAAEIPGFFQKRDVLYAGEPDAAALRRQAEACLAAGLLDTALEYYLKVGDTAGLERVAAEARKAGDVFSFGAAMRALERAVPAADWVEIGERALREGKLSFAYRAFEKADHQDGLERVRREMAAAGIQPPQSA
jgi:tetratricopeptide (TPR) repeat protein